MNVRRRDERVPREHFADVALPVVLIGRRIVAADPHTPCGDTDGPRCWQSRVADDVSGVLTQDERTLVVRQCRRKLRAVGCKLAGKL